MEIKQTTLYKWLKRNSTVYFLKYKLTDKDYAAQKKHMLQSKLKSEKQIQEEMVLCREYWGCDPSHYVRYGLFDHRLCAEELPDYIPPFYFYNYYMAARYEGIDTAFYNNKLNLFKLFSERGIPTPEVIAIIEKGILKGVDGKKIETNCFVRDLKEGKKYFFKPIDGAGGTGIEVLNNTNNWDKNSVQVFMNFVEKLDEKRTYVIQEGIEQRHDFHLINASSVNTLRIITQQIDNTACISACVLRMGRNGRDIDNSHQGGISCMINKESGELFPKVTAEHGGGVYTCHPDSGFTFEGQQIHGWESIKNSVLSYANRFPELKEIGWDIAVTEKGITVLELNVNYGIDHLQCCCGGMRRKLNVYPKEN